MLWILVGTLVAVIATGSFVGHLAAMKVADGTVTKAVTGTCLAALAAGKGLADKFGSKSQTETVDAEVVEPAKA